jgi:hypothetical protein
MGLKVFLINYLITTCVPVLITVKISSRDSLLNAMDPSVQL